MSSEYEEVISLKLDTSNFNVELNKITAMVARKRSELEKLSIVEFKSGNHTFIFDLNKAYRNGIKGLEQLDEQRNKDRIDREKRTTAALAAINADANSVVSKQLIVDAKRVEKQFKASEDVKTRIANINRDVRIAADKSTSDAAIASARAVEKQFKASEDAKQAAIRATAREQTAANAQARAFNNTFMPKGAPLPIATSKPAGVHVSSGLRAGAGAAGALGAYPAAGALYASANAMQLLGSSTLTTTQAFTGLAAIAPLAIGVGVLFAGKELNIELARMSTLLGDASISSADLGAMLDKATTSAITLAGEFNLSTVEVVKAFKEALSSGIEDVDLERFTRSSAQLSTALSVGLTQATDLLTSFKDSYQLSVGEMAKVNDILFNTIDLGKVNVAQLTANFGRLLPVGKAANISIEDLAASIAVMTRRGMTTANSITSMTQMISGLATPSDKAKRKMDELGIAYGEAAFNGRAWLEIITDIAQKTGGSATAIGELFPEERANRGFALETDSLALFGKLREGIEATGTASVAASRAMDTLWTDLGKSITSVWAVVQGAGSDGAGIVQTVLYGSQQARAASSAKSVAEIDTITRSLQKLIDTGASADDVRKEATNIATTPASVGGFGISSAAHWTNTASNAAKALDAVLAKVKDNAIVYLREVDDSMSILGVNMNAFNDKISKENGTAEDLINKEQTYQISKRINDEQAQAIVDLRLERDIKREILQDELQKAKVLIEGKLSKERNKFGGVNQLRGALDDAVGKNDTDGIRRIQVQLDEALVEFTKFAEEVKKTVGDGTLFEGYVKEIEAINAQMSAINSEVLGQATKKERALADKKQKEQELASDKERDLEVKKAKEYQRIRDKAKADSIRDGEHLADVMERLYKEDTTNYKQAQEEKVKEVRRLTKEIEKESGKAAEFQARIAGEVLNSKIREAGDDPDKRRRIAEAQRELEKKNLDRISTSGGTREEFDAAVDRFQEAAELVRDAMSDRDLNRAERNYREDLAIVSAAGTTYSRGESASQNSKLKNANDKVVDATVRSPQEIARAAASIVQQENQIKKVVLDAQIKLDIDGTLSKESMKALSQAVYDKIKQAEKNSNVDSNYDSVSRRPVSTGSR